MAESKGFNLADVLKNVPKLDTSGRERIEYIDIARLEDDPNNFYALSDLDGLVENIELVGLQQPLRVRPNPKDTGYYIIVSGHRRRAAIRKLVEEGREDLREIACIVESGGESAAMQELRLIYANSGTRKLTDAELSAQAEKVEMLLYRLREEGVEFPGRMRDHVAQACQVSKSKLARLKVIREGLADCYKNRWSDGAIPEAAAYELARMPLWFQARIDKVSKKVPDAHTLSVIAKRCAAGETWTPELKCPDGGACKHGDGFLHRSLDGFWYRCDGKTCCLECREGAVGRYYACDRMCSKAKAARKARQELDIQKTKRAEQKLLSDAQKKTIPFAQRVVRAADAAGLEDAAAIRWENYEGDIPIGHIRQWAEGDFENWHGIYPRLKPDGLSYPVPATRALKCSADYLLGLTDELHPAVQADMGEGWVKLEYIDGPKPPEKGQDAVALFDLGDKLGLYRTFVRWDGRQWTFPGGVIIEGKCVGWFPIPPMPKDAPEPEAEPEPERPFAAGAACSTGFSKSGQCGSAAYCDEPHDCCADCHKDCNARCGWIPEEANDDETKTGDTCPCC